MFRVESELSRLFVFEVFEYLYYEYIHQIQVFLESWKHGQSDTGRRFEKISVFFLLD